MLKDPRDYQILFLSTFLGLGAIARDWTLHAEAIAVICLSCGLSQLVLTLLEQQGKHFQVKALPPRQADILAALPSLRSAAITALSLCLLLRANHLSTLALAGMLAIASKFLLKFDGKHVFNPANFGIVATLLLTHDAWVSPGQWGTDWWAILAFAGAAGIVLRRVGRWDTSAAFLAGYAALEVLRNAWLGWGWNLPLHHLCSGSLLLFALFMLTDPRTIPNSRQGRLVWATAIAGLTFGLRYGLYLSAAPFWALFAIAPLTALIDRLWSAPRFTWQEGHPPATSVSLPSV